MLVILWISHFMVFNIHLKPYVSSDLKVRWNELNLKRLWHLDCYLHLN